MNASGSAIAGLVILPADSRWAGEDDHFNKTKLFPIRPIRERQQALKGSLRSPIKGAGCVASHRIGSSRVEPSVDLLPVKSGETRGESRRAELEKRNRIRKKYSRIHLRQARDQPDKRDDRLGYDRLFSRRVRPEADYPYANPIPKCLLTDVNIDNLRDIIVDSARGIEWKMLTPVRPESDYEEKFFDKLIELHRSRYKARLELGYHDHDHLRAPFKYTRHRPVLIYHDNQADSSDRYDGVSLFVGAHHRQPPSWTSLTRIKRKYRSVAGRNSLATSSSIQPKLTIPTLTLTRSDSNSDKGELIRPPESLLDGNLAAGSSSESQSLALRKSDAPSFSYEKFSRFSQSAKDTSSPDHNRGASQSAGPTNWEDRDGSAMSRSSKHDELEEQLDEIVSQLINVGPMIGDESDGGRSPIRRF